MSTIDRQRILAAKKLERMGYTFDGGKWMQPTNDTRIHARGALIKVLDKPHLDLTTPIGRGFIAFRSPPLGAPLAGSTSG